MTKALVVFESMYGNTAKIAMEIGQGLEDDMTVEVIEVGQAPTTLEGIDLLVVGGPTHAHGLSNAETRHSAAERTDDALVSSGIGIREWMKRLDPPTGTMRAAVFDTRIKGPRFLWGSAARKADDILTERGFALIAPAESFLVSGPTGPLDDALLVGEVERARAWGVDLASRLEQKAIAE